MTVAEAADVLGVSTQRTYNYDDAGKLRPGGRPNATSCASAT
jgi:predicted site-specific integrase-resolvase